jgi:hypothetical protein
MGRPRYVAHKSVVLPHFHVEIDRYICDNMGMY